MFRFILTREIILEFDVFKASGWLFLFGLLLVAGGVPGIVLNLLDCLLIQTITSSFMFQLCKDLFDMLKQENGLAARQSGSEYGCKTELELLIRGGEIIFMTSLKGSSYWAYELRDVRRIKSTPSSGCL